MCVEFEMTQNGTGAKTLTGQTGSGAAPERLKWAHLHSIAPDGKRSQMWAGVDCAGGARGVLGHNAHLCSLLFFFFFLIL